jgi:uncharacterized protein (TIGR04222 family)
MRLARENGWELAFARRVVDEYKRFVYLAMTAGHEVTPSDEVDQAWHLHLTYTRSYWDELCGKTLGRPLHHGPTRGGQAEGERFREQYAQTLASYRTAFGQEPPPDVWPAASIRFGEATEFVRVNRRRVWLIPKLWPRRGGPLPAGAALALLPPLAAGAGWNPLNFDGPTFLRFYAMVVGVAIVGALLCRRVLRASEGPAGGALPGDDPIMIGALRGGWQGAFHAAMAGLLAEGAIVRSGKKSGSSGQHRYCATRSPAAGDPPVAQAILLGALPTGDTGATLATLEEAARPFAQLAETELAEAGLLETASSLRPARLAIALCMGAPMVLGIAKLVVGIWRDKPVGYLAAALAALAVATWALLWFPLQTRTGRRALALSRQLHGTLLRTAKGGSRGRLSPEETALAVGLFGVAACSATQAAELQEAVKRTPSSWGGCGTSGCGSGDGGGGCGGGGCGGGGCGGCGG